MVQRFYNKSRCVGMKTGVQYIFKSLFFWMPDRVRHDMKKRIYFFLVPTLPRGNEGESISLESLIPGTLGPFFWINSFGDDPELST